MAKGEDTRYHQGRQVGPHLSPHWRPIREGSRSGPLGNAFAQLERPDVNITAWNGSGGNHAEIKHEVEESYGGASGAIRNNRYVVGPFRDPPRTRAAGEAAANRLARGGDMSKYEAETSIDPIRNPRYPRT
jgi:hypothetical protein